MIKRVNLDHLNEDSSIQALYYELYGQPIVDLHTQDHKAHLEFLTRFYNSENEILDTEKIFNSKDKIIPLDKLDLLIFEEVLKEMNETIPKWKYKKNYSIAINVSAQSIENYESFFHSLDNLYDIYPNVAKNKTCLEINENANKNLSAFVKNAYTRGFNISVDDIGTRNATIQRVEDLIIPEIKDKSRLKIKIDKSYFQNLLGYKDSKNKTNTTYITAVLALKKKFPKILVVAEGVETSKVASYAKSLGIDYGQGFYWSQSQKIDENYKQPQHPRTTTFKNK